MNKKKKLFQPSFGSVSVDEVYKQVVWHLIGSQGGKSLLTVYSPPGPRLWKKRHSVSSTSRKLIYSGSVANPNWPALAIFCKAGSLREERSLRKSNCQSASSRFFYTQLKSCEVQASPKQCCGAGPFWSGSGFFFTGSDSGSSSQKKKAFNYSNFFLSTYSRYLLPYQKKFIYY